MAKKTNSDNKIQKELNLKITLAQAQINLSRQTQFCARAMTSKVNAKVK